MSSDLTELFDTIYGGRLKENTEKHARILASESGMSYDEALAMLNAANAG